MRSAAPIQREPIRSYEIVVVAEKKIVDLGGGSISNYQRRNSIPCCHQ